MYLYGDAAASERVRLHAARGPQARAAGGRRRAGAGRARLRERAPHGARHDAARAGAADDRHRPPPRQLPLRRPQPRRRRRLLDRRGPARPLRRARRRADAGDRGGALHRRSSPTPGRFQYTNTTPKALRLAAELVEAGADVHRIFQSIYESVEFAKLKLLARALERAQVYEGGRLVVSYLLRSDFTELNVAEAYSEGIIDYLRAVEGAEMAALIREPPRREGPARRVSLRASNDELDVSAIARKSDGGGHRQAAGFSSDKSVEEITRLHPPRIRHVPPRGLSPSGLVLVDKPEGPSSFALVRELRDAHRRARRPRGHARPVCERALARAARLLDPPGAVPRRAGQALRDGGRPALAHLDRRPRGRRARAARAAAAAGARAGRGRASSARSSCRSPPPPRSRSTASGPTSSTGKGWWSRCRCGARRCTRRDLLGLREGHREARPAGRLGHLRACDRRSLGGHCSTLRRTEVGPFRVEDSDRERILPPVEALPFLPLVEVSADEAQAIRTGRTRHDEPVRVVHDGELVAVDGTVMPS